MDWNPKKFLAGVFLAGCHPQSFLLRSDDCVSTENEPNQAERINRIEKRINRIGKKGLAG
jgi:hypothetical protein